MKYLRTHDQDKRWIWTPFALTAYFGAGGWVYLNIHWLWEKFSAERQRRIRVRAA